jgi:hypothetical protein
MDDESSEDAEAQTFLNAFLGTTDSSVVANGQYSKPEAKISNTLPNASTLPTFVAGATGFVGLAATKASSSEPMCVPNPARCRAADV